MDIINYKYKDFIKLNMDVIEEYTSILFLYDEPTELKRDVDDCTLDEVEQIRQGLFVDSELFNIMGFVDDCTEDDVMNMEIVTLFGKLNTIKSQLETINNNEMLYLQPEYPNVKMEMVNAGEKLQRFGILPMVDSLAGGDVLKWEAILKLPYSTVFRKLFLDTVMGDINHRMDKIKTKL